MAHFIVKHAVRSEGDDLAELVGRDLSILLADGTHHRKSAIVDTSELGWCAIAVAGILIRFSVRIARGKSVEFLLIPLR